MTANLEKLISVKQRFHEQATIIIREHLQNFMRLHPNIKALGWTQYTPYFNDGDPCTFGVNGLHVSTVESEEERGGLYEDTWQEVYGGCKDEHLPTGITREDYDDALILYNEMNNLESELQATFGDHVKVIVTRDGVAVDEYEHD